MLSLGKTEDNPMLSVLSTQDASHLLFVLFFLNASAGNILSGSQATGLSNLPPTPVL